jgi:hypothetical protein
MARARPACMGRPRRKPPSPGRQSFGRTSRLDCFREMASFLSSSRLIALQVFAQKGSTAMNPALAAFAGDAQAFPGTHVLAVDHLVTSFCPITASTVDKEGHSTGKDSAGFSKVVAAPVLPSPAAARGSNPLMPKPMPAPVNLVRDQAECKPPVRDWAIVSRGFGAPVAASGRKQP